MKLVYQGPKNHRRIDGRRIGPGFVLDAEGETAQYLLGLKLNDGRPEFVEQKLAVRSTPRPKPSAEKKE
jgi:hypothetical protein